MSRHPEVTAALLLGLDLGTTRLKAVLVDGSGVVVERAAAATPFVTRGGGIEMDVAELELAVAAVLGELEPTARDRVAGIGIAGLAESGVPLIAGRPVGPVLAWFDGRGEQAAARLGAALPDLPLRIGQRVRAVSSVAKLGWLLAHGFPTPEQWLGVPETILFLLTGAAATDPSLAARTGAYDIARREWMPEVVDFLGLPADAFAAVQPAGSVMGRVTDAAAVWFGVPAGVPVTVAGHDHLAAAEGIAGTGAGDLLNSVGTAETMVRLTAGLPDVREALDLGLAVTLRPTGEGWAVLASASRSGLVLNRLAAELGQSVGELDELAVAAGPLGIPRPDFGRRTLAPGLEVPDGPPGDVWAATLHALAARAAAAATTSTMLTGPAERLLVFGGGSRSRPWLEAKVRLFGPRIEVLVAEEAEATARGAALAGGVAAGWWPSVAEAPPGALSQVSGPKWETS